MRPLDADRFLKIGVLLLKLIAKRGNLIQGFAQFLLIFPALGYIAKDHDCPDKLRTVVDRGRDILDADRLAILAPEHLVLNPVHLLKAKRLIDRAFMRRVFVAAKMVMMDYAVDITTNQVRCGPAKHLLRGAIHERGLAIGVNTINPFARRIQDQLVFAFEICKESLGALPFDYTATIDNGGRGFCIVTL